MTIFNLLTPIHAWLLAGMVSTSTAFAYDPNTIVWQHQPITFSAPIGKERLITFPDVINQIRCLNTCSADAIRYVNYGTHVSIFAARTFETISLAVTLEGGLAMQLDVNADTADAPTHSLTITLPTPPTPPKKHHGFWYHVTHDGF